MTKPSSTDFYKSLLSIRKAEQAIIHYYPEDDMKTPMHMSMGQEPVAVGVCEAVKGRGQVFGSYRSHAAFLAFTGDLDRFFAELYGRETGTAGGKGGSMHLSAPETGFMLSSAIVGSSISVAVGAAFASKSKGSGISCVFFGDGAVDEGTFWESLNVAALMGLPVLFVCEDNGLAVHTSSDSRRGYKSLLDIVSSFDCSVFDSDSTDVEEIYDLAVEAIDSIASTGKPAFLQLSCYRYLEHVGTNEDFEAGYRTREQYEAWLDRDGLSLQRQRLLASGVDEDRVAEIENEIDQGVADAVERAKKAPAPGREALYTGVYYEKD